MNHKQYETATDEEILRRIGARLKALRKARRLTQTEASTRAGLGRVTLYRAEQGDNPTLRTLTRLLRVYGELEALERFIPVPELSPMARLRERRGKPKGKRKGKSRGG